MGRSAYLGTICDLPAVAVWAPVVGAGVVALSPAGETVFAELRAALVGYHSQTAFQRAHFLRLMSAWTAQEFRAQLKK